MPSTAQWKPGGISTRARRPGASGEGARPGTTAGAATVKGAASEGAPETPSRLSALTRTK